MYSMCTINHDFRGKSHYLIPAYSSNFMCLLLISGRLLEYGKLREDNTQSHIHVLLASSASPATENRVSQYHYTAALTLLSAER